MFMVTLDVVRTLGALPAVMFQVGNLLHVLVLEILLVTSLTQKLQ